MMNAVEYIKIDDAGLHIRINDTDQILDVDHIVICAGQESNTELLETLRQANRNVHLIGGASKAAELDAKRAIDQGSRLAAVL